MAEVNTLAPALQRRLDGLAASIQTGDCVLVLGPGIAAPGKPALAMAEDLARQLHEDLGAEAEIEAANPSLRRAIAHYERRTSPQSCRTTVQRLMSGYNGKPTPLHLALATLPFKLVLSATFDNLMSEAFRLTGKPGVVAAFYNHAQQQRRTPLLPALEAPTTDKPLVYSLLGRSDHPESMVLNEQDLLDYLVRVSKDKPALPDALRATIAAPAVMFLFIGFGFENWWLRLLLKVLEVIGTKRHVESLAVEGGRLADDNALRESKDLFSTQGIFIQSDDWNLLVQELRQRVAVFPPGPAPAPAPLPVPAADRGAAQAPPTNQMVFLSYASQDKALVDHIRSGLEARGFSVWQDKNQLRAGQAWRPEIEEVIRRVRFFVFVQTEQMDQRDKAGEDGVYHRELALALDRTKDKLYGTTFVIMVTVGACQPRRQRELQALHHIAVDDEAGLDRLARDMRAALQPETTP